ncbi:VPLPA-CTERM sorting domain-containing protein [Hyphococcus luteus]|jgi:hypothetical protein|uniref:PEP-CTERM protein-sorting domain-containing protein n=1 Tax=Hyphococcus luteus TaxID=2058213 RepID=A0A2S7K0V5_9PROT|nr:VPLPA-CTERM sorting domain-containing protein [Marinicaulis flavus]PQA86142.1 hypothetical protein CW354_17430 [Marinicaulis flavus]
MKLNNVSAAAAFAAALFFSASAFAAPVSVNETDAFIGGDYQNLFLDADPDNDAFDVEAGANTFDGSIVTPGDGADVVIVSLDDDEIITGFIIEFATNSDAFNPVSISQNTKFLVEEFDDTPLLLTVPIGGAGTYSSPSGFTLPGGQLYSLFLGSEVLALLNGAVEYRLTVNVESTAVSEVPLPAGFLLMGAGIAGLGAVSRRRRRA